MLSKTSFSTILDKHSSSWKLEKLGAAAPQRKARPGVTIEIYQLEDEEKIINRRFAAKN